MRKLLLFSVAVMLAVVGCVENDNIEDQARQEFFNEMSVSPISTSSNAVTRGYSESAEFEETYCADGSKHSREMQISAYIYPQNGEEGNYFVDKTFLKGDDGLWHASPAVFWPVGGMFDFLAFSLTTEKDYNRKINVRWDSENAAAKVVLTVPAENTQNDILYASVANLQTPSATMSVPMQFSHAQAWLEFQLTGKPDGVVKVKEIQLEKVYNAGALTISNNGGEALAQWNFSGQNAKNIPVDNIRKVEVLDGTAQTLDMLIPQQPKTAFVIYYTLGSDSQVLSYRFETDQKTWLMGEKYVYKISVNTNEVTVHPEVAEWKKRTVTQSDLKVKWDEAIGSVSVEALDETPVTKASWEGSFASWGSRAKLTAYVNDDKVGQYAFDKWSDGNTENPRTVIMTGDEEYKALFRKVGFTVDESGTKVKFSQGNLNATYHKDSEEYIWGFASKQYSFVGNAAGNIKIGDGQEDGAVVDLFGWSTSDKYGINASKSAEDYKGDFVDWGGTIKDDGSWRTLTLAEVEYLLNSRTGNRYCKAKLSFVENPAGSNVMGLMIFPDGWSAPSGISISIEGINVSNAAFDSNILSMADFKLLEASGCAFLPAAGFRDGLEIKEVSEKGRYWTSSINPETEGYVFNWRFDAGLVQKSSNKRYTGRSVRLVSESL